MKGTSAIGEYVFCPITNTFFFSDGVSYSLENAMKISHLGIDTDELLRVHNVLRVFDGELLEIADEIKYQKCTVCRGRGMQYIRALHTTVECTRCNGSGKVEI